jgi:hypothetical protein
MKIMVIVLVVAASLISSAAFAESGQVQRPNR